MSSNKSSILLYLFICFNCLKGGAQYLPLEYTHIINFIYRRQLAFVDAFRPAPVASPSEVEFEEEGCVEGPGVFVAFFIVEEGEIVGAVYKSFYMIGGPFHGIDMKLGFGIRYIP